MRFNPFGQVMTDWPAEVASRDVAIAAYRGIWAHPVSAQRFRAHTRQLVL